MLARLVKAYRETEKISTRDLAQIIGIDHTILWRFEQGKEIRSPQWVKIAKWVLTEEVK